MASEDHSFKSKLKYSFDNFMSKGGFSVFSALMLLFVGAFILMAIVRFVVNIITPQENLTGVLDQFWQVFLQISDAGAIAEDTSGNILNKITGIITVFFGLILFSSLVAFITSQFEAKLDELRKGKSNVVEKNHTLILGFGDRVLEIIRELIIANESEKNPAVVVLAEREKDEMDDFFRDRIEHMKNTRIVARSGSTSSIHMLRRVGVGTARSVIILNDAAIDASEDEKSLADARVLKTILALMSCTGEVNAPPIVAELHNKNMRKLAKNISPDKVSLIDEHSILAKLMVQTSRVSGLAQVYDNLVGFEGCEFYYYKPDDGLEGIKYGDLIFHFKESSVFGLRKSNGMMLLNPSPETVCRNDDEVIVLAEDDSTIRFLKQKLDVAVPQCKVAGPHPKSIENQLIVGWSFKTPSILDEYSKYLLKGSKIDVVLHEISEETKKEFNAIQKKNSGIKMRLLVGDLHIPSTIAKLKPEQYDNVIILSGDGGNSELRDSETIAKLLEFRHYFKTSVKKEVKTQLITEVADSENIEVIQEAGVKDFLISNQFVSKIYAQVSEEPSVLEIYDDLFSEEGSEVYLKPVSMFLTNVPESITFGELCAAAVKRKESCFGVRLLSEETDINKNFGIYVNPPKDKVFKLSGSDWLITLAENES
jgi:K+/H+ antiporter YhaU regulatory subunit KhtT